MPRIRAPKKKPPDPDCMDLTEETSTRKELDVGDAEDAEAVLADVQSGVEGENSPRTFSVVKMKLNTLVHDGRIKAALRKAVADMNVVVAEAYLFANFHVARLLRDQIVVPSIDRNFYYRCLLAVSINNCRRGTLDSQMNTSLEAFDLLRPEDGGKVDVRAYGHLLPDASVTMATMACNHVWTNLSRRLSRFLSWRHPEVKKALRARIVDAVALEPGRNLDVAFRPPWRADAAAVARWSRARELAERLRGLCPLGNKSQNSAKAALTLPLFRHVLEETIAAHTLQSVTAESPKSTSSKTRRRFRTFSLLPNKNGFTASHVQFCKMSLLGMLKRLGLEAFKGDGRALSDEEVHSIWQRWFGISEFETRQRRFGGRIATDGCAVAAIMNKPSSAVWTVACPDLDRGDLRVLEPTRVGVDPGVTDVVTVAREDGSVASYSSARYYEAAHFRTSARRVEAWNAETRYLMAGLEGLSRGRTADLPALEAYARAYLAVLRELLEHRSERGYRSMRFLRFVGKQRAVDAICELVAPRASGLTVVGFGDWAGPGGTPIKRRCAGPLQEIKFRLSRRSDVVLRSVWEHKTSVTCHQCFGRLVNMRAASVVYRKGAFVEKAPSKVHKVLHCKRSEGGPKEGRCGVTWNRDVNASKNILMLLVLDLLGEPRHAFCPGSVPEKKTRKKRKRRVSEPSKK